MNNETKTEVTFPVVGLAAVMPMAAVNDIRYYLNGVLIEVTPTHVTYVGTDGHTLAVAKCECTDNTEVATFIVRREDVATILKNIGREDALRMRLVGAAALEIEFGGHLITTHRIEGKFPDWRKAAAVPAGQRGQNAAVNPKFLERVSKSVAGARKFGAITRGTCAIVEMNGADRPITALVRGDEFQVAYVLMPMRVADASLQHTAEGLTAAVISQRSAA